MADHKHGIAGCAGMSAFEPYSHQASQQRAVASARHDQETDQGGAPEAFNLGMTGLSMPSGHADASQPQLSAAAEPMPVCQLMALNPKSLKERALENSPVLAP